MSSPQRILEDHSRDLFAQAIELPQDDRTEFLRQACGGDERLRRQLLALVQAHAEADVLFRAERQIAEQPGQRIGHYKLLQKIGEGGFGTVWMAEQEEPVQRMVALKVLKAGMDTAQVVGRFEGERQALAMMDHPNIAKVFDGGATPQGRPYFVMELVKGVPITRYCDDAGLDMRERLELFVPVCQAVQHAHQKGIIHRDLKPSNVLVTLHDGRPVPKVIDFGIAKATTGVLTERTVFTEFQQMLGTPEYMAPEQAALSGLDLDTRADIYSLGVLLYELLTGTRPFELKTLLSAGYAEVMRTIKEVDPPKPSTRVSTLGDQILAVARQRRVHPRTLSALVRGDLDWIVMRALEKERNRRYETATALCEDVLRHLRHEPVQAGPPSRIYRLRKYVRRHRVGVMAGAAIAVSLVAGAIAAALGYFEAQEQARLAKVAEARAVTAHAAETGERQRAERHAEEARREEAKATQVVELLERMLASSSPYEKKGKDYTLRQLLDDFASGIGGSLEAQPEVEATLRRVMGKSYQELGMPAAAEPHFRRSVELARRIHGATGAATAEREIELAVCVRDSGRFDEALAMLEAVADRPTGESALEREARARCMRAIADVLALRRKVGDLERAEKLVRQALERQAAGKERDDSLSSLMDILGQLDRFEEAQQVAEEGLAHAIERDGEGSLSVAVAKCNLALAIERCRGDLARAAALLRDALEVRRKWLGDHPDVEHSLNNLASTLAASGDFAAALALFTEARDMRHRLSGEHVRGALLQQNVAMTLQRLRRYDEAKAAQEVAIAMRRRLHGVDHRDLANALCCLGDVLKPMGDVAGAARQYQDALAMYSRLGMESDARSIYAMVGAAELILDQGRAAEAEPLASAAASRLRELPHVAPHYLVRSLRTLGLARLDQRRVDAAEAPLLEALARARVALGEVDIGTAYAISAVGEVTEAKGDLARAEELYRQALDMWRAIGHSELRPGVEDLERLARVLAAQGKTEAAIGAYRALLHEQRKRQAQRPLPVALALGALATVLHQAQQFTEAASFQREGLDLLRQAHGGPHTSIATALNNLGEILSAIGNPGDAAAIHAECLEMLHTLGMEQSLPAATCQTNLGRALAAQGKHTEAEAACRRALETFRSAQGHEHPNYAKCLSILADVCTAQGDHAGSLTLELQALELRRKQLSRDDPEITTRLAALATRYVQEGRAADAEPVARECLEILRVSQPDSWLYHRAQALVGRALAGQGDLAAAETLLVEACSKMQPPTAAADNLKSALRALITLYGEQGKAEQADVWRRKLAAVER